jgi:hypothetical protein
MTETEWIACDEPQRMLVVLRGRMTDRKSRLFACACCRRIWNQLSDPALSTAVEVSERFADQDVGLPQLQAAARKAHRVEEVRRRAARNGTESELCGYSAAAAASAVALKGIELVLGAARSAWNVMLVTGLEHRVQADLVRDIFGNPFRPVAFAPEWRTDTAVTLARQMYEAREFSAMPILADALQDAGCEDASILEHCRGPGPHVRGCWVVDLVLGKA